MSSSPSILLSLPDDILEVFLLSHLSTAECCGLRSVSRSLRASVTSYLSVSSFRR